MQRLITAVLTAMFGTLFILWDTLQLLMAQEDDALLALFRGSGAVGVVIVAGVYPLLMYLGYVLSSLLAEICRAIFDIARNTHKPEDSGSEE